MQQGHLPWSYFHLSRIHTALALSEKEKNRLRALGIWQQTRNVSLVCDTFGISRATLYRWIRRFNPTELSTLRERSRRPRTVRRPLWTAQLIIAIRQLRNQYPRWGKQKLVVLLRKQGLHTSPSTVGRILVYLKRKGSLEELPKQRISARKRRTKRFYATRKPKQFPVERPGDLVQLDTLDIRPFPGFSVKQFTARDFISRWDVCEVHSRATAQTAKAFLKTLVNRMPFTIKAIQIDGGSEFFSHFEEECKRRGILLFVLPPKSPKLNGRVERANRTHTEEFYQINDCPWSLPELNVQLKQWENTYNYLRPHQALGYLTPAEYLKNFFNQ